MTTPLIQPAQPNNGVGAQPIALPPHCAIFIYDPATGGFGISIQGQIPTEKLVNQLELLKARLIEMQLKAVLMQTQAGPPRKVVMPDGSQPPPDANAS